jgi:hypothetical protein
MCGIDKIAIRAYDNNQKGGDKMCEPGNEDMDEFRKNWKETWNTSYLTALEMGKTDLAERCRKIRDISPDEDMNKEEFLRTLREVKQILYSN